MMRAFQIARVLRVRSSVSKCKRVGVFFHHSRQQQVAGMESWAKKPAFWKTNENGSEEEIEEEEFYRYTRYRWLCDETQKRHVRYLKFNIPALLETAVVAVGNGATSCVKMLKCVEGQYNKAILLTMDNGVEVFAKLPNPNAGPKFFTTASEVATRCFIREVFGIPTPRILASSFDSLNAVGAEYIIEETARGKPLGSLWNQWPAESKLDIISQIVDVERKLNSVSFLKHGCIYFKRDLESRGIATESLTHAVDNLPAGVGCSILDGFSMGPLTEASLWQAEREEMRLDHGPWTTTAAYLNALSTNEIRWVKSFARPRMNYHRSMERMETTGEFLSLLTRFTDLVPYLIPRPSEKMCVKTLSHPDLHLDNIFVDPTTGQITSVIDWQSASVSEAFLHRAFPPMLPPPDTMDQVDNKPSGKDLFSQYKLLTKEHNPRHWSVLNDDQIPILSKPISLLCGAWNREDVFSFRHALINVVAHWEQIFPTSIPCPIDFTEHELELHAQEMELIEDLGTIMHQLQDENMIPLGGMVKPEHYEQAQNFNCQFKEFFISSAENEQQRILHSKIWPYQDRAC